MLIYTLFGLANVVIAERLDRTRVGERNVDLPCCGVFEMSGWSEQDVMGADVVSAFGLQGFEEEKNPVKLTLE